MREALESVIQQTYPHWEILLIDDGSDPDSTQVALQYVEQYPDRVLYFQHPGHQNRGISASSQLGIHNANGAFVGFLDADDIWLANKLEEQVAILEEYPEASMIYGNTQYWYSWIGQAQDLGQDFIPKLGITEDRLVQPPRLLTLFLLGKTAVPCICSLLVRRKALETIGGFEEAFQGMYEDQVFYAKMCLETKVYVSKSCWDKYRKHPASLSAVAESSGKGWALRVTYLEWLDSYLTQKRILDPEVWLAVRRELWFNNEPNFGKSSGFYNKFIRRMKKWLLKIEERVLPPFIRRWVWARSFGN
jgi:glycosyltransferase involved in cell wall biosynthesis